MEDFFIERSKAMNIVVYDLEMTNHLSEIIEIGAVRLVEKEGILHFQDTYQSFVKPIMDQLDKRIEQLTGITKSHLAVAPHFFEAADEFKTWIGVDDYFLCSWGPEDKWALINDALYHQYNIDWLINHNDIQLTFSKLYEHEVGFRYGLTRALKRLKLEFDGSQHRALDDAINTAKILQTIYHQTTLKKDPHSFLQSQLLSKNEVVYQTEEGQVESPFSQLKKLLGS